MRALVIVTICWIACLIPVDAQQQPPRRFPSAIAAFCLPGEWQAPTDPDTINEFLSMYGAATAEEVKRWELEHSDFIAGGNYGTTLNQQHIVLGYAYIHTISDYADGLKKWAYRNNKNYEDFSLHFKQDTIINTTAITATSTFWAGKISAGYTSSATHYGFTLNDAGGDVFQGVANGGAFFIWAPLPFYEIRVDLSRNGVGGENLVIECPTAVDENFNITQWSPVTVISDGTNVFSQPGTIRIAPPANWRYARLYPPHGFYSHYLVGGGGCFALRIRAYNFTTRPLVSRVTTAPALELLDGEPYVGVEHSGSAQGGAGNSITLSTGASSTNDAYKNRLVKIVSGTGAGQVRLITAYNGSTKVATVDTAWDPIPDNTSQYKVVRRVLLIRGWNPANDRNGDGFVDDSEYANLADPNATARMRHYSRVILTNTWATSSMWDVANVFSLDYRQAIAETTRDSWSSSKIAGCYIDDAIGNGLGRPWVNRQRAASPAVLQGGYIWEYDGGRVDQDSPTGDDWFSGYIATIQTLKQVTGSNWIGANIANSNPFTDRYASRLPPVLDWFLCEDTIKYSTSVDWWGGLALRPGWIYPAIAARGALSFLFAHHGTYYASGNNTRETWEERTKHMLAYFYMVNIPNKTAILFWNYSYTYGSKNTDATYTYWKAGVPKNYAYQPTRMLQVDIGVPANTIPEGKQPMDLQWYPISGDTMWKIGDTTSTQLTLPNGTVVPTIPTYIYILQQIDSRNGIGQNGLRIPFDAVYARNYTKGLVLMRLKHIYSGISDSTYENTPVTVQLPGTYRVVNYDGTLGPPVTEVSIRGGEGMILVSASQTSTPNVQLTMSVDKQNPKPLDVVTVTITATNTGTAEARNVRVTHDIPQGATYVQGSLKLNGNTLPDPTDTTKIDVTVPSIPAGGQATVEFQMVIR